MADAKSYMQEIIIAMCSGGFFDYQAFVRRMSTIAPGANFSLVNRTVVVAINGKSESIPLPDGCTILN